MTDKYFPISIVVVALSSSHELMRFQQGMNESFGLMNKKMEKISHNKD